MRAHAVERLPTKSLANGVTMFQTRIICIRHDHPCIGSVNLAQRHLAGKAQRGLAVRLNPMLGPASGSRCSTLGVSRDYLRPSGFAAHINDNDNDTERSKRWERPGGLEPGTWGPATEPVSSTSHHCRKQNFEAGTTAGKNADRFSYRAWDYHQRHSSQSSRTSKNSRVADGTARCPIG